MELEKELWTSIVRLDKDFLDPKHIEEFNRLIAPAISSRHLNDFQEKQHQKTGRRGLTSSVFYQQDLDGSANRRI